MSAGDFDSAFTNVIGIEGNYSNRSPVDDPGGETKFGISKRSYPDLDIPNLTLADAKLIYRRDFWNVINADKLHPVLAEFLFDYAVNSGPERAAKALQRAIGALPDGIVGIKTLGLVGRASMHHILRLVFVDRACLMAEAPNYEANKHGWFARLYDKTEQAVLRLGHI
jgi:lysozyme family protein